MALFKKKGHGQQKKVNLKFAIDCAKVVEDKVVIMRDFEKYLRERIKVDGKKGNLGTSVTLSSSASAINLVSEIPFSKRYLKYLTKKYLKKVKIAEYLRVVATEKSKYELKYLKIHNDEEEEEEA
jgi:large subunit ribosomal protein L22e